MLTLSAEHQSASAQPHSEATTNAVPPVHPPAVSIADGVERLSAEISQRVIVISHRPHTRWFVISHGNRRQTVFNFNLSPTASVVHSILQTHTRCIIMSNKAPGASTYNPEYRLKKALAPECSEWISRALEGAHRLLQLRLRFFILSLERQLQMSGAYPELVC